LPGDDFAEVCLRGDAEGGVDLVAGLEELFEEFDWYWGVGVGVGVGVSRAVNRT